MARPIRKAVFPVAGLGTRFLPATKAVPKEMLPVVDRPLIDYAVAEAAEAGVTEMIFVTGARNTALERYFDRDTELEETLEKRGKITERDRLAAIAPEGVQFKFAYQDKPLGLGHAVWCAREFIGDDPFAVLLPDDLVWAMPGCLTQMTERYANVGGNLLAVENVPSDRTDRYGILKVGDDEDRPGGLAEVLDLVEKPTSEKAPSTLAIIGRYILQRKVLDELDEPCVIAKLGGPEVQLTAAIAARIGKEAVHGFRFQGKRFDCGEPQGWLTANNAISISEVRSGFADKGSNLRVLPDSAEPENPVADTDDTGGAE